MNGGTLVRMSYSEIPGLVTLQSFANSFLALALGAWMALELYRLLTRGQCDFVTPIIRVGLGFAIVSSLPWIGEGVSGLFEQTSKSLSVSSDLELFGRAFTHALGDVSSQTIVTSVSSFLGVKGLLAIGSLFLYLGMLVIKIVVIDVLWPVCLGLVVVLGLVAVPLGVLPGMGTLSGWFRNLVEVSLWPLVFQLLVGMMTGAFKGTLVAVTELDGAWSDAILGNGNISNVSTGIMLLVRWWALCVGYVLLCLFTPVISSMAVRSTPVASVASMAMHQVMRLSTLALGALGGAGLAKFATGAFGSGGMSTMGGASAHGGHHGFGAVGNFGENGHAVAIDRRSYAPQEGGARS